MSLSYNFQPSDHIDQIELGQWEKSISSFATAGRLTARLVLNTEARREIGPFCGNSLGKYLFQSGLLDGSQLALMEKRLAQEVLAEGIAKETLLFDTLRLAIYPLAVDGKVVGYVSFGYTIDRFMSQAHVRELNRKLSAEHGKLWRAIRNDVPLSDTRFRSVGELAENLSSQIVAEWALRIKLQDAVKAKDLFLSSVTHELRTPLQSLLLNAELLEMEHKNSKSLLSIKEDIWHLDKLINQLFDYVRYTRDKVRLDLEEVDLLEATKKALKPYDIQASKEQKKLLLINNLPSATTVKVDRLRYSQVISNLVSNALKFTDEEGTISVSLAADENVFTVTVKDSGIGIQSEYLSVIFNRFVQGTKTKTRSNGLGLGLSICKEISVLHNGKIFIESEGEDRGTLVHIEWPLRPVEEGKP